MIELLYRRPDGSLIASMNGLPYHVIEGELLFADASSEAARLGDALPFEPLSETAPPTLDDYRLAIQAHVDETARQRGYDAGVTCASYLGSTVAQWAAEATAFVAWRDAVWAHAYAELEKVQAEQRAQPRVAELIAELPILEWPEPRG